MFLWSNHKLNSVYVCVGACTSLWPYFMSALVSGTLRCRNSHLGIGFLLKLLKLGHVSVTEFHWSLTSFRQHGNAPYFNLFGQWRHIFQWNSLKCWVLQNHSEAVLHKLLLWGSPSHPVWMWDLNFQQRIEPRAPAVEVLSLNYWTAREVPGS